MHKNDDVMMSTIEENGNTIIYNDNVNEIYIKEENFDVSCNWRAHDTVMDKKHIKEDVKKEYIDITFMDREISNKSELYVKFKKEGINPLCNNFQNYNIDIKNDNDKIIIHGEDSNIDDNNPEFKWRDTEETPSRPLHRRKIGARSGKPDLTKQSKGVVANVYKFFRNLADNEDAKSNINFAQVQKLTADACGISVSSVQRISKSICPTDTEDEEPIFKSPRKSYKREHKCTNLNDFNKHLVRSTVFHYYDHGQSPTGKKIHTDLVKQINYIGSVSSVFRILKSVGFKFKKCNDGRKFLMERKDIAAARAKFLRTMHLLHAQNDRPIVYLDETWISENHCKKKLWQESRGNGELKIPFGRDGCLIIIHAGSAKTGFVPEAKLVIRIKKCLAGSDYHSVMNSIVFKTWFTNLLHGLKKSSIIVMDNASYHCAQIDRSPRSNWRKSDIIEWLHKKGIAYRSDQTRDELLSKHEIKNAEKTYELDQLAKEMGHEVVRLPPYHCQYNPIEYIWAQVKSEVAEKNVACNCSDIEQLTHEALDNIGIDDWVKCVRRAEHLQEADYIKECARGIIIEPFIIRLNESSDDSSESERRSSEDDEYV